MEVVTYRCTECNCGKILLQIRLGIINMGAPMRIHVSECEGFGEVVLMQGGSKDFLIIAMASRLLTIMETKLLPLE